MIKDLNQRLQHNAARHYLDNSESNLDNFFDIFVYTIA